jgi:hypothetical protein
VKASGTPERPMRSASLSMQQKESDSTEADTMPSAERHGLAMLPSRAGRDPRRPLLSAMRLGARSLLRHWREDTDTYD